MVWFHSLQSVILNCHNAKNRFCIISWRSCSGVAVSELTCTSESPWFWFFSDRLALGSSQPRKMGTWGFPRKTKPEWTGVNIQTSTAVLAQKALILYTLLQHANAMGQRFFIDHFLVQHCICDVHTPWVVSSR